MLQGDDGSLVFHARLSPEDGAVVLAALEAGRAAVDPPPPATPAGTGAGDSAASHLAETKSADALVAMANLALAAPQEAAAPVPEVIIVDRATLSGASDEGRCHIDGGVALPPETCRRLACDATVVAMIEAANGTPLDVGRKRRTPPPRLRRALRRRDGGCRFPGCGRRRFLHAHHIVHWINGGETKLVNLILLCSHHHRLVHEGGYRIESLGDHVFVFFDRAGREVPVSPPPTPAAGLGVVERNEQAGLDVTADSCRSLGGGESYDLGLAVEALLTEASTHGADAVCLSTSRSMPMRRAGCWTV